MQTLEQKKAYQAAYYAAHREQRCKASRAYRSSHKEEYAAQKKCYRQAHREKYAAYLREYRKTHRDGHLQDRYGITEAEYERLRTAQHGCCAICGQKAKLCVDHDHATGKVRGLLCHNCNRALGGFKDRLDSLRNAVKYLGG